MISAFYLDEKSISRRVWYLPIEKFLSLVLLGNEIILQLFIIQCLLYYLSSGRLWGGEGKKILNLREVVTYKRFQIW